MYNAVNNEEDNVMRWHWKCRLCRNDATTVKDEEEKWQQRLNEMKMQGRDGYSANNGFFIDDGKVWSGVHGDGDREENGKAKESIKKKNGKKKKQGGLGEMWWGNEETKKEEKRKKMKRKDKGGHEETLEKEKKKKKKIK